LGVICIEVMINRRGLY